MNYILLHILLSIISNQTDKVQYYLISQESCTSIHSEHEESIDTFYIKLTSFSNEVTIEQIRLHSNEYPVMTLLKMPKEKDKSHTLNYTKFNYKRKQNKIFGPWEESRNIINKAILHNFNLIQEQSENEEQFINNGHTTSTIEHSKNESKVIQEHTYITSAFNISTITKSTIKEISGMQLKKILERHIGLFFFDLHSN